MKLFISYAPKDPDIPETLIERLKAEGYIPPLAENARDGTRRQDEVAKKLHGIDTLVVIMTRAWLKSRVCHLEFTIARSNEKTIICILFANHADGTPLNMPLDLIQYSGPDVTGEVDKAERLKAYLDDLLKPRDASDIQIDKEVKPSALHEINEERRLDAAMPRQTKVSQSTPIWVQICLPTSEGFRNQLPYVTEEGDIIDQGDIKENRLAIKFPLDAITHQAKPVSIIIEIKTTDFELFPPSQTIILNSEQDSKLIVFQAKPLHEKKRSIVRIVLKSEDVSITLGFVELYTQIQEENSRIDNTTWSLVRAIFSQKQISLQNNTFIENTNNTINVQGDLNAENANLGSGRQIIHGGIDIDGNVSGENVNIGGTQHIDKSININASISGGNVNIGGTQHIYVLFKPKTLSVTLRKYNAELQRDDTGHEERRAIGHKLGSLSTGDVRPGIGTHKMSRDLTIPDIAWCSVDSGRFYIAKYPVTVKQYLAFYASCKTSRISVDDFSLSLPKNTFDNYPVVNVTWYQATAFCLWLTEVYSNAGRSPDETTGDWKVQLPQVDEWILASGIRPNHPYPWGEWKEARCNAAHSGLQQVVAVGLYPKGAAPCGAEDMIGNIWELSQTLVTDDETLVLAKGGAYNTKIKEKQRQGDHPKHPDAITPAKAEREIHTGFRPIWIKRQSTDSPP